MRSENMCSHVSTIPVQIQNISITLTSSPRAYSITLPSSHPLTTTDVLSVTVEKFVFSRIP